LETKFAIITVYFWCRVLNKPTDVGTKTWLKNNIGSDTKYWYCNDCRGVMFCGNSTFKLFKKINV